MLLFLKICFVTPSLSNFCQKIISLDFFEMGLTSLPPIWTMSVNILFVFFDGTLLAGPALRAGAYKNEIENSNIIYQTVYNFYQQSSPWTERPHHLLASTSKNVNTVKLQTIFNPVPLSLGFFVSWETIHNGQNMWVMRI